jgi:hypothetical protein
VREEAEYGASAGVGVKWGKTDPTGRGLVAEVCAWTRELRASVTRAWKRGSKARWRKLVRLPSELRRRQWALRYFGRCQSAILVTSTSHLPICSLR